MLSDAPASTQQWHLLFCSDVRRPLLLFASFRTPRSPPTARSTALAPTSKTAQNPSMAPSSCLASSRSPSPCLVSGAVPGAQRCWCDCPCHDMARAHQTTVSICKLDRQRMYVCWGCCPPPSRSVLFSDVCLLGLLYPPSRSVLFSACCMMYCTAVQDAARHVRQRMPLAAGRVWRLRGRARFLGIATSECTWLMDL